MRSRDLVEWESLGTPFTLADSFRREPGKLVWAPELHWLGDRWALVHCPAEKGNLALSAGAELKGPWTHPMGLGWVRSMIRRWARMERRGGCSGPTRWLRR